MCQQCRECEAKDKAMWEAIRLGLVGVYRGLGAVIKAVERRYEIRRDDDKRAA